MNSINTPTCTPTHTQAPLHHPGALKSPYGVQPTFILRQLHLQPLWIFRCWALHCLLGLSVVGSTFSYSPFSIFPFGGCFWCCLGFGANDTLWLQTLTWQLPTAISPRQHRQSWPSAVGSIFADFDKLTLRLHSFSGTSAQGQFSAAKHRTIRLSAVGSLAKLSFGHCAAGLSAVGPLTRFDNIAAV